MDRDDDDDDDDTGDDDNDDEDDDDDDDDDDQTFDKVVAYQESAPVRGRYNGYRRFAFFKSFYD